GIVSKQLPGRNRTCGARRWPARARDTMLPAVMRLAPATTRNREPILEVLREIFTAPLKVLEIASGTGEHAVFFARALPHLEWQPSDVDPTALASIEAHREAARLDNLLPPVRLDVEQDDWAARHDCGAIVCINMIHISPWSATAALFRGGARTPAEILVTYGP